MMWFPSLLLILAFTSAFADIEQDIQACISFIDVEELEQIDSVKTNEDMKVFCPMILNTFDCVEGVLKRETGLTFVDLAVFFEGEEIGRGATVVVNVKSIFEDLCTEGSELNEAYLADAECFDSMEAHVDECKAKARETRQAVRDFAENAVEEVQDREYTPDGDCMEAAYLSACIATQVHEACGRRAFDTYNQIVKRSTVFRNVLCSAEDLEHLKTTFVDTMDLEDDKKKLLRLALDLKKRRK